MFSMYQNWGRPTNYDAIVISSQCMLGPVTGEKYKDRLDMLMYAVSTPPSTVLTVQINDKTTQCTKIFLA